MDTGAFSQSVRPRASIHSASRHWYLSTFQTTDADLGGVSHSKA